MQKEQRLRLIFTIAACLIIVALSVALILVLIPSRENNDSDNDDFDTALSGILSELEELSETQYETGFGGIDFDEMFATFSPDTPMIVAGDSVITWEELFSGIHWGLSGLYRNLGTVPDLSEPLGDDTIPLGEVLLELATDEALSKLAVLYNARLLGIELSDEDSQSVNERVGEIIEHYGGEDEFLAALWEERGIHNIELFRQNLMFSLLPYVIFRETYGEEGELLPSEQVLTKAEEEGFVMAKHILITFS